MRSVCVATPRGACAYFLSIGCALGNSIVAERQGIDFIGLTVVLTEMTAPVRRARNSASLAAEILYNETYFI